MGAFETGGLGAGRVHALGFRGQGLQASRLEHYWALGSLGYSRPQRSRHRARLPSSTCGGALRIYFLLCQGRPWLLVAGCATHWFLHLVRTGFPHGVRCFGRPLLRVYPSSPLSEHAAVGRPLVVGFLIYTWSRANHFC